MAAIELRLIPGQAVTWDKVKATWDGDFILVGMRQSKPILRSAPARLQQAPKRVTTQPGKRHGSY